MPLESDGSNEYVPDLSKLPNRNNINNQTIDNTTKDHTQDVKPPKSNTLFDEDDNEDLFASANIKKEFEGSQSGQQGTVICSKTEDAPCVNDKIDPSIHMDYSSDSHSMDVNKSNVSAEQGPPMGGVSLFGSETGDILSSIKARKQSLLPLESSDVNE